MTHKISLEVKACFEQRKQIAEKSESDCFIMQDVLQELYFEGAITAQQFHSIYSEWRENRNGSSSD